MENTMQRIGIVGIGQIGLPIAVNLIRAGFTVAGYRRTPPEEFQRHGGHLLRSPAEVARASDVVLLCLPDEAAQGQALDGDEGVMQGLRAGHVVIEMGTYGEAFKRAQAQRIEARGCTMLESEVSGSPVMVAERRAALYLGGDVALIERCKPVLEAVTPFHFRLGDVGSAVRMKLIANYLIAIHTLAAAEAMNLGVRAGFSGEQVAEVIGKGAGSSTMFAIRAPIMASRKFQPAPGPMHTLEKYLEMGARMAQELGCATPLFSTAAPYYWRAIAQGMGEQDIAAVVQLIEAESVAVTEQAPDAVPAALTRAA